MVLSSEEPNIELVWILFCTTIKDEDGVHSVHSGSGILKQAHIFKMKENLKEEIIKTVEKERDICA